MKCSGFAIGSLLCLICKEEYVLTKTCDGLWQGEYGGNSYSYTDAEADVLALEAARDWDCYIFPAEIVERCRFPGDESVEDAFHRATRPNPSAVNIDLDELNGETATDTA